MTNLIPLNDNIIVKRDAPKDVSDGGIIMTKGERSKWGTVVAIGPGKYLKNGSRASMDFKIGEKVMLQAMGAEVHHDGEDFVIMREKDILMRED